MYVYIRHGSPYKSRHTEKGIDANGTAMGAVKQDECTKLVDWRIIRLGGAAAHCTSSHVLE